MTDQVSALPPIAMTRADIRSLIRLADAATGPFAQAGEFLSREIDRAEVVDDTPSDLVRMGSRVTFRDDVTGQERTVTLSYPEDADLSAGRISVLTPIGAALIGLSVGQSIEWRTVSGGARQLTVLAATF